MSLLDVKPEALEKLLGLLTQTSSPLEVIAGRAASLYPNQPAQNAAVVLIRALHREARVLATPETHGETIVALHLLHTFRKGSSLQSAKAAFFDVLLDVERQLREDAKKIEQLKYRASAAKDSSGKKNGRDAGDAEGMRCRCIVKVFAFRCLSDETDASVVPNQLLEVDQATVDAQLDSFHGNNGSIKEGLAEITMAFESDAARHTFGGITAFSAAAHKEPVALAVEQIAPTTSKVARDPIKARDLVGLAVDRPLPAAPAPFPGELRSTVSGSMQQALFFDSNVHPQEWRETRTLIAAACKGALTMGQQQQLLQLCSSNDIVNRVGLTPEALQSIARFNPQAAASILLKIENPTAALQLIVTNDKMPPDNTETLLLNVTKVLQQVHVFNFIAVSVARLSQLQKESTEAKSAVTSFATTLHQLVTKGAKDNKEIYIADTHKKELVTLLGDSGIPAVVSRWDEMK